MSYNPIEVIETFIDGQRHWQNSEHLDIALPANVDVARARLPATYEHAKIALASCERIDECWEWANKAEALASYAKMADDDSLRQLSDRIQARAVRRMGELLKQFDGQGRRTDQHKEGTLQKLTQTEMAKSVGISEHQRKQAVRVANVPAEKFETAIEQPKPATVTQLADIGKQSRSKTASSVSLEAKQFAHGADAVNRVRPPDKVVRRALKEKPVLKAGQNLKWTILDLASLLHYEDWNDVAEHDRVKPATYWEYLTLVGDDHTDAADSLDEAIKTLKAIRHAMPRTRATPP
jgi:hypothetical protein